MKQPGSTGFINLCTSELNYSSGAASQMMLALQTGINRDEIGNAQGGICLPDFALGRGAYIATDPSSFYGMALFGAFQDLQCEPLPDGSPRFAVHATYVSQYSAQIQSLVDQRFLLREDATRLIA